MIKICIVCGKEFEAIFQRQKCCSLKCKAAVAKTNRQFREPRRTKTQDVTT